MTSMPPMTPVPQLQNGRSTATTPTLNPFLTEISGQETPRVQSPMQLSKIQNYQNSNMPTPTAKPMISTPKSAPHRPPLPPVPPRSRAASIDKIRIPIDIVRRLSQRTTSNSNMNQIGMTQLPTESISQISPTKVIPETNGTVVKTNGMDIGRNTDGIKTQTDVNVIPKQNGNSSCHIQSDLDTHNQPCPCKSGAHPKHSHIPQENGYHTKAVLAPGN